MSEMPTCRECLDFLADYIDGKLPAAQLEVFEMHMDRCPPCRDYLASYRATIVAAKGCVDPCTDDPPSAEVSEKLVRAIIEAMKRTAGDS